MNAAIALFWRAFAFFAFVGTAAGAASAADIDVDTERNGDAVDIGAGAVLTASREIAWRVLTDYARYAEFLPDMHSSRILSRDRNEALIEQRGEARFLWLRLPMQVTLAVIEAPGERVESRMVAGTLRAFHGRYELARAGERLTLQYSGQMVLDEEHRGVFDSVVIRQNVRRQFRALVNEIERVASAAPEQRP